ncbi:MAG: helicase, partial [Ignavibacteriae bacterium]|nr:helicase [Ignavibacteriota bacterium]
VNIVPLVADLIGRYQGQDLDQISDEACIQLPLKDQRVLSLPMGRIKPLVRLLLHIGLRHINEQQALEMTKYQFLLMCEMEAALASTRKRWQGGERLRSALMQLTDVQRLPAINPPKSLNAVLRDYQAEGLNWLQFLRGCKFCC